MKSANRLREQIHHTLQQTANDLEAQKQATEYAFRKRIHEFERAKDELEWQKKNVCFYFIKVVFKEIDLNKDIKIFHWYIFLEDFLFLVFKKCLFSLLILISFYY